MPNLNNRLAKLEKQVQALASVSDQERAEQAHFDQIDAVWQRWFDLAEAARERMTAADRQRLDAAVEVTIGDDGELGGPFADWLRNLVEGRCRLPQLKSETMKALLLAWLHPEVERWGLLCQPCGLEYPMRKAPPRCETWQLLPGKTWDSPPPRFTWQVNGYEFFQSCPHCGASRFADGASWPHLVQPDEYPWQKLDGYVPMLNQPAPVGDD